MTTTTAGIATTTPAGYAPTAEELPESAFFAQVFRTDLSDVFFSLLEFAETAQVRHAAFGVWKTYPVLFDDPSTTVKLGGDAGVSDLRPQIQIATKDLYAQIGNKDRVLLRGVSYLVEDVDNDGVGVATVYLRRK